MGRKKCGHAAANHESDEWDSSALRAAAGTIKAGGIDAGNGRIYAATDLRNSTDKRDLFHASWPALGAATRNGGTAAPDK
jgi:hypothetical protein